MNSHMHKYRFESEISNSHKHRIVGYTDRVIGIATFHFHSFYGISSYDNHTHYFSGITGLPIKTENGHIHRIEGILEVNVQHEHSYAGNTMEDVAYKAGKLTQEAFV
ncbi:MAG: YmaF family protein [Bacillota bacterium]|nr:YmaF family protein [Bacillota bacterium]